MDQKRIGGLEPDRLPMPRNWSTLSKKHLEVPLYDNVFVNPDTGQPLANHGPFLPQLCANAGVEPLGYHATLFVAEFPG